MRVKAVTVRVFANLINELIKTRNLYKISDKINKNSSLGLTNGTEFHISYSYDDSSFRELIFGNQDFSLSSRYMMTGENTQVYEIDSSMDNYLTTSIQNWAEPYIISQTVFGKITPQDIQRTQVTELNKNHIGTISDVQKLLDLRHGGRPEANALESELVTIPETVINLELGNKNEIELEFYKSEKENEFIVTVIYKAEKNGELIFTSTAKISSWTYNKIKEITL